MARDGKEWDRRVGLRLRVLRIKKRMSQAELGATIGVSYQQIQKYERGLNGIPVWALTVFVRVLETTYVDLLGDEDRPWNVAIKFEVDAYLLAEKLMALPKPDRAALDNLISCLLAKERCS